MSQVPPAPHAEAVHDLSIEDPLETRNPRPNIEVLLDPEQAPHRSYRAFDVAPLHDHRPKRDKTIHPCGEDDLMCDRFEPRSWRTPNEWWFVAICQYCGLVTSSICDGGTALSELRRKHNIIQQKLRRKNRPKEKEPLLRRFLHSRRYPSRQRGGRKALENR